MTMATTFGSIRVPIQADGTIVIPAEWVAKISVPEGQVALVAYEDGELRVFSIPHGIKTAQDIFRKYKIEGRSMADELIAERRRESASDDVGS